ncbi:hypothetical protein H632_c14p2 [Helicosporidium sp. ATCC 50920]|nr:hypothetical protein H632_c14p2 [Helicosporidium sp. ATCC 50920]|eukprot:KDD77121.1 hypothetical protein H632_c14p2 [Helicosporidium sp. ATCC 50920]
MSDAVNSQRLTLDKVLAREEKHEASSYEPSPEVQGPPPADFQVEDTAGDCLVKLVKTSGKETITVEVIADEALEHEEFEEEGEEEASPSVAFSVLVSKGDQSLAFTCLGQGDQPVQIQGVTLERDEEESTGAYAGPIFDELDPDLQTEFDNYLQERGIDSELAQFLAAYCDDKEQREYRGWLGGVRNFLQA